MNELRDLYTPPDTFECYLCNRTYNLRSGLDGHMQNFHALDGNGQPVAVKKIVKRRTGNNAPRRPPAKKSRRTRSKKKRNAKKPTIPPPPSTSSNLQLTDDYPLPYDDFFYDYTFNEYESLILSHYNLTPILKNDQSGTAASVASTSAIASTVAVISTSTVTLTAADVSTSTIASTAADVSTSTIASTAAYISTSTIASASTLTSTEAVISTSTVTLTAAVVSTSTIASNSTVTLTATVTSTATSDAADQHLNTSQLDHQFRRPEVPPLRHHSTANSIRGNCNSLMAGTYVFGGGEVDGIGDAVNLVGNDEDVIDEDLLRGGYVYADEHLFDKIDYNSFIG